jgi:hypothetical protein
MDKENTRLSQPHPLGKIGHAAATPSQICFNGIFFNRWVSGFTDPRDEVGTTVHCTIHGKCPFCQLLATPNRLQIYYRALEIKNKPNIICNQTSFVVKCLHLTKGG